VLASAALFRGVHVGDARIPENPDDSKSYGTLPRTGDATTVPQEATGVAGLAGRYATALFELADQARQLDAVATDLRRLQAMFDGTPELRRLIANPVIARDNKTKAMLAVLDAAQIGGLVRKFVGAVAGNSRLAALPAIIRAFLGELARRRGESAADVVSAVPLSEAQRTQLADVLRGLVGGKVSVNERVDPDLLGGLVVRVGSRMFDSSLRTKLQRLQIAMKGVG
jgi:F-type H+-transporting ATPase subunit delta